MRTLTDTEIELRESYATEGEERINSGARAPRAECEQAARELYIAADLTPPPVFLWAEGPREGLLLVRAFDAMEDEYYANTGRRLINDPDPQGYADQNIRRHVDDKLRTEDRAHLSGAAWGIHELPWIQHYRWAQSIGVEYPGDLPQQLERMNCMARAGWWWPYGYVCVISEPFLYLRTDPQGRLHSADGPAIAFRDGLAVYAWHDTVVPAEVINRTWEVPDILAEPNSEIRRCAIEARGWDWFVEAAELDLVDSAPDPGNRYPNGEAKTVFLYHLPERFQIFEEPVRVVICTNGTPEPDGSYRRFGLTVPANVPTVMDALAWMHRDDEHPVELTAEEYAQLQRRC